jgi:cellulose synthase (UDP-forming)
MVPCKQDTTAVATLYWFTRRSRSSSTVGGLGPELAEDHSTTLLLNNGGWDGCFAIDAIAHGDGAESFSDSMLQEFQWSRSLTNILLTWRKQLSLHLPLRKKIQFLFSEIWYIVWSFQMYRQPIPAIALLTGSPWVSVNYFEFLWKYTILMTCLLPFFYLQTRGFFRPVISTHQLGSKNISNC